MHSKTFVHRVLLHKKVVKIYEVLILEITIRELHLKYVSKFTEIEMFLSYYVSILLVLHNLYFAKLVVHYGNCQGLIYNLYLMQNG